MQIPKEQILELLRSRGDHDGAGRAQNELPGQVDTERDAGLLGQFGLNPQELIGMFGGGGAGGGIAGGIGKKLGL